MKSRFVVEPEAPFPAKLVFVGGAPRAGTTVTHALLCTAPGASPYTPEISFFHGMAQSYVSGLHNWKVHTHGLFSDQEHFRRTIAEAARGALMTIWRHLGSPEILCLKDPMLTPLFPALSDLLPEARFVTVCRHPFDVVRSHQEVYERGGRGVFDEGMVQTVARNYVWIYARVLSRDYGGRLLMFRYEDLKTPRVCGGLANLLGVPGFDENRMWVMADGQPVDRDALKAEPTFSPKYSGAVDLTPRLEPLKPEWQALVASICESIMRRMDYR